MITILQSLIVYFGTAIALYVLGRVSERREAYYLNRGRCITFWTWEITLSLLLFAFISGLRWNVGVDYQAYLGDYAYAQSFGNTIKDYEPGFELLTEGMAILGFHYGFYFAILAFLQLFFVYQTFKYERDLLPYVGLTVVLGFHYLTWMNGIRQMLAATIFLFSIQFIVKRNLSRYVAMIFIASLFHKSSLMLLVLYLLPNKDLFSNRFFLLIISLIFLYIGMDPNWVAFAEKQISFIVGWFGYENYSETVGVFIEQSKDANFGPRMLTTFALFYVVVFFSKDLKKQFSENNFMMYYNIYVIGFLAYSLFINSHHIFLRPVTYLTICSIAVVAYLLVYLSRSEKKSIFPFLAALVLATIYTPLSIFADYGLGDEDYSNYKTFLFRDY